MIYCSFPEPLLALDPSLNCTGYSVFIEGKLVDYGVIHFRSKPLKGQHKETTGEKLYIIELRIKELIDKWNIKLVVMEKYMQLFSSPGKNNTSAETASLLPMVRGVMVKTFFERNVKYINISFNTVKKIATGNHKALKEEIRDVINEMYELSLKTEKDTNISDAIAVGYSLFTIYDFKIQLHKVNDYVDDIIDFFEKYNGIKSKTQKALRMIGVDISKWKAVYK